MTEACSHITCHRPGTAFTHSTAVGTVLSDVELSIRTENENPLPLGSTGIIWLKTPQLAQSYLSPDGNKTLSDAWFKTNDRGSLQSDGTLLLAGRNDDVFISGGENISKSEIETVILHSKPVSACAVIAVPHPQWSE